MSDVQKQILPMFEHGGAQNLAPAQTEAAAHIKKPTNICPVWPACLQLCSLYCLDGLLSNNTADMESEITLMLSVHL